MQITFTRIRNAALGMVVAVIASFGYSVLVLFLMVFRVHALDVYWVGITLWFALPSGAVFGAYLPQSMAALNRKMAMGRRGCAGVQHPASYAVSCGLCSCRSVFTLLKCCLGGLFSSGER